MILENVLAHDRIGVEKRLPGKVGKVVPQPRTHGTNDPLAVNLDDLHASSHQTSSDQIGNKRRYFTPDLDVGITQFGKNLLHDGTG